MAEALDITVAELIQCKKQDKIPVNPQEIQDLMDAALELIKYQEQLARRRILIGLLWAALGVILLFTGIRYFLFPTFSIGGGDGPTAIFIAGKISRELPAAAIAAGAVLLLIGLWKILKKKQG